MDRVIYSPMKYVQGEGAWQRLHEYAAALGQKGAYAVAGPHVLEHYWSDVEKGFKEANFPLHAHRFAGECSMNEINRIVNELREENCDVIIGIGGGGHRQSRRLLRQSAGYYCAVHCVHGRAVQRALRHLYGRRRL